MAEIVISGGLGAPHPAGVITRAVITGLRRTLTRPAVHRRVGRPSEPCHDRKRWQALRPFDL